MVQRRLTGFGAKEGTYFSQADAEKIGPVLCRLAKEGEVDEDSVGYYNALVVAEAKKKRSPLHEFFEWDLRKAAESYWQVRAGQLTRAIEIVYDEREGAGDEWKEQRIRAFVSIEIADDEEYEDEDEESTIRPRGRRRKKRRYVTLETALSDEEMAEQMLSTLRMELDILRTRFQLYTQLIPAFRRRGSAFWRALGALMNDMDDRESEVA